MNHLLAPYALVIMRRDNKILLLQRSPTARFAPDHYSLVGGSVEKNETFRAALVREASEEVGIIIDQKDLHFEHVFYRKGTEHEIVVCMFECRVWQGEPYNREPDKHAGLMWVAMDSLPEKMIPAHYNALKLIAQQCLYSEQP